MEKIFELDSKKMSEKEKAIYVELFDLIELSKTTDANSKEGMLLMLKMGSKINRLISV